MEPKMQQDRRDEWNDLEGYDEHFERSVKAVSDAGNLDTVYEYMEKYHCDFKTADSLHYADYIKCYIDRKRR